MTTAIESGNVEYTGRAFHQDAMDAMRGDIVRGLIETVTNSDDAYASMADMQVGKITVEVEHRRNQPWRVITRDRATGMSAETMKRRITQLGGRTSGFESGEARRGNLGRGAKDLAAFGDVTFASICDGQYAELLLTSDGRWELRANRRATVDDREALGIRRGNGTFVSVTVQPGVRCPQHDPLKRKLATHFQLRDILSDARRRVDLVNLNDGSSDRLTFEYLDLPVVYEGRLDITGYDEAEASLVIRRHAGRFDAGPDDPGRPIGILIKGRRAIYENTLFRFETDVNAGWFTGELTSPYIDDLAREYDDRHNRGETPTPENPFPIISRRRDGLNSAHPFVQSLREAAEGPLGTLIAEEAARAREALGEIETNNTRAAFNRLERELSRLLTEELRDIDAEELPDSGEGTAPALAIIPEQAFAYLGEDRVLTVAARAGLAAPGDLVEVEADPVGVVEIVTTPIVLQPHTRREDVLVGQVRLRPLLEGESTIVTVRMGNIEVAALVEVRSPRDDDESVEVLPESLQFERSSYRIGWQREKRLEIMAPAAALEQEETTVWLVSSDPGIVLRAPTAILVYDEEREYFRGFVLVQARTLNATGVITARLGDLAATTRVAVVRREEAISLKIRLTDDDYGPYRAIQENEPDEAGHVTRYIKIAGRHPALRPFMGDDFSGQDSPICRGLIAEIVADLTSRLIVSELYRLRSGTEAFDVDRFYREHYRRMRRLLPRCQRTLVGDPRLTAGDNSLPPSELLQASSG